MPEQEIGHIEHYFSKAMVAALKITKGSLKVGDTVHFKGHTTDFNQAIDSMQIDHKPVMEVKSGDDVGIKVKDHVRDKDTVYKVN